MRFEFPKIRPHAAERFPLQPRLVQQWLKALPDLDLDEAGRKLREALELANRQKAPPRARMESMELLSAAAVRSLMSLRKRLVARSLPLSVKTQAAFRLHQDLSWELQTGYAIALQRMTGKGVWPSRGAALATHRALELLYHEARMAMTLYQSLRAGFWARLYAVYRAGETAGTLDHAPRGALPAQDLFLHTVILMLAHPYGLRYGETRKFAEFLKQYRPPCPILRDLSANAAGYVSCIRLDSDTPPAYVRVRDISPSPDVRTVHLTPLLDLLAGLSQTTGPGTRTAIMDLSALPPALCDKLIRNLGSMPARRFSRMPSKDHVEIVFGLGSIHDALEKSRARSAKKTRRPVQELLQQLDPSLTATAALSPPIETEPASEPNGVGGQLWQVVNMGAGGYQLHWPQLHPSGAQVGELLALRVLEGPPRVYVGAVRWMQARSDGDLDIGVQLLAPKAVPLRMELEHVAQVDNLSASPALWLPAVKALKQPPTLVTPVGRFDTGNRVVAMATQGQHLLELGDQIESTGLFERFGYRVVQRDVDTSLSGI